MNKTVLAIVAHPDDAEFLHAGTLTLLKQKGWKIEMATMTPGDGGPLKHRETKTIKIRKAEAATWAPLLKQNTSCIESEDIFIFYDKPTITKTIALIRKVKPQIVLTMSPTCYMEDHMATAKIVQTACFAAGVKNIETEGIEPYFVIPHLYYGDAMEGKDLYGNPVKPSIVVDISTTIDTKEKMLKCHASQREWLLKHHGIDEYILTMKRISELRGKDIGAAFGEGFRQHLGHAFPQDNILEKELGSLVHDI